MYTHTHAHVGDGHMHTHAFHNQIQVGSGHLLGMHVKEQPLGAHGGARWSDGGEWRRRLLARRRHDVGQLRLDKRNHVDVCLAQLGLGLRVCLAQFRVSLGFA